MSSHLFNYASATLIMVRGLTLIALYCLTAVFNCQAELMMVVAGRQAGGDLLPLAARDPPLREGAKRGPRAPIFAVTFFPRHASHRSLHCSLPPVLGYSSRCMGIIYAAYHCVLSDAGEGIKLISPRSLVCALRHHGCFFFC